MLGALLQPRAVAMARPPISPIAHPVRQWVVADAATRFSEAEGSTSEPASADVGRRVPAAEARDLDHVTGVRRVDELSAPDVDPFVAEPVEEDEVAGLELIA